VFTSFDVDGSGTLSLSELSAALNLLGIDLTEEELADTYRIDGTVITQYSIDKTTIKTT